MQRKLQLVALLFVIGVRSTSAQSLTPFVISSSGDFYSNGAGMLSSTVGEMTMVETFAGGTNILTQGFQQALDFGVSIIDVPSGESEIVLYPNPATDKLNISIRSEKDTKYILTMVDDIGQKISTGVYISSAIGVVYNLDISRLAVGVYLIQVESSATSFSKTIRFNKM